MTGLALAVLMPISVSLQKSRARAFLTALSYYAAASWPLVRGAKAFFGPQATWTESALLGLASSFFLALPFGLFWTRNRRLRPLGILGSLVAISLPPLGLIGWASPLAASGVLFPGSGWLGLGMTAALCALFCSYPRPVAAAAGLFLFLTQATYHQAAPPPFWQAMDTRFGSASSDPLREFQNVEAIERMALDSRCRVMVFPEMVIQRWNDATEVFWQKTLAHLRHADTTMLLGAGLSVPGQNGYLNAVLILGSHADYPYIQRIPVPIAMWKPYSAQGVPLRLHGAGTVRIANRRVAILICYEQLLVWPYLASALERPSVTIGVANDYWAARTRIPAAQQMCLHAWSRLFCTSCISATNW
jgi:hypothetical protein